MTDIVNPSTDRSVDSYLTAGTIAYCAGVENGFIIRSSVSPTQLAEHKNLTTGNLNAFGESSTSTSLSVTIDGGEAFVGGSYVARDTTTSLTLNSNSSETIYLGWDASNSDTAIIGRDAAFDTEDKRVKLWTFSTDSNGVTNIADGRTLGRSDITFADGDLRAVDSVSAGLDLNGNGRTLRISGGDGSGGSGGELKLNGGTSSGNPNGSVTIGETSLLTEIDSYTKINDDVEINGGIATSNNLAISFTSDFGEDVPTSEYYKLTDDAILLGDTDLSLFGRSGDVQIEPGSEGSGNFVVGQLGNTDNATVKASDTITLNSTNIDINDPLIRDTSQTPIVDIGSTISFRRDIDFNGDAHTIDFNNGSSLTDGGVKNADIVSSESVKVDGGSMYGAADVNGNFDGVMIEPLPDYQSGIAVTANDGVVVTGNLNFGNPGSSKPFAEPGNLTDWRLLTEFGAPAVEMDSGNNFTFLTNADGTPLQFETVSGDTQAVFAPDSGLVFYQQPATYAEQSEPPAPITGWSVYTDTNDGNLKAKKSDGTIVTLAS